MQLIIVIDFSLLSLLKNNNNNTVKYLVATWTLIYINQEKEENGEKFDENQMLHGGKAWNFHI